MLTKCLTFALLQLVLLKINLQACEAKIQQAHEKGPSEDLAQAACEGAEECDAGLNMLQHKTLNQKSPRGTTEPWDVEENNHKNENAKESAKSDQNSTLLEKLGENQVTNDRKCESKTRHRCGLQGNGGVCGVNRCCSAHGWCHTGLPADCKDEFSNNHDQVCTKAYAEYGNYCVDANQGDMPQDGGHGELALEECKALCDATAGCTGVEFYREGWSGSTCYLHNAAVTQGSNGIQWRDAICFVRAPTPEPTTPAPTPEPTTPVCACESPGAGTAGHNKFTCTDGSSSWCAAWEECYATVWEKGKFSQGCRRPQAPPPEPSTPAGCIRPQGWCIHSDAHYAVKDCDGDGVADPYCTDIHGHTGFIPSAGSCKDTWPGGTCKCARPQGWCIHSGAHYAEQDCDGDGVADPYCTDGHSKGFIPSAGSCKDTWPGGTCGLPQALQTKYMGCFAENQLKIKRYIGMHTGSSFKTMYQKAEEDEVSYFGMSRHQSTLGGSWTVISIDDVPAKWGYGMCGSKCDDDPDKFCGCANQAFRGHPNPLCNDHDVRIAVYQIR